jgi:phage terminase large subunit-like protein
VPSTGKRNGELGAAVYWDLAATEKTDFNDPDWTVAIKLGRDRNGGWVLDMVRARSNPGDVERLLRNTAEQDGKRVRIGFGQDPGQAGKSQALDLVRALDGFTASPASESATSSPGSGRSVHSAVPAM